MREAREATASYGDADVTVLRGGDKGLGCGKEKSEVSKQGSGLWS